MGLSGEETGGVVGKLGVLTPWGVENSLIGIIVIGVIVVIIRISRSPT